MKRLIIIFFVFLSVALQAQMPGVVASSGGVVGTCIGTMNLLIYSEVLSNGVYEVQNETITDNQANDLEGNNTLESCNAFWDNMLIRQSVTVTGNTTYRFSFDAQRGTATAVWYRIFGANDSWANIVEPTNYYNSINASTPTRISIEFTTPANCTHLHVEPVADIASGARGTTFIGRLQLESNGSCYIETTDTHIHP
jgi:hypothetical protein